MTKRRTKAPAEPEVDVHDPSKLRGTLKPIGGSMSDEWNNIIANQTVRSLWLKHSDTPVEDRNVTQRSMP